MKHRAVQQQVLIEHETMAHIVSALRNTMSWHTDGLGFSRKLASLRFVGESFLRHLKHLMQLEKAEGYLSVVTAERPELSDQVRTLRKEGVKFRKESREILARLKRISPENQVEFIATEADLSALLDRLDEHHRREIDLLQEALLRDEGGEG
jgi:hypothetical protein